MVMDFHNTVLRNDRKELVSIYAIGKDMDTGEVLLIFNTMDVRHIESPCLILQKRMIEVRGELPKEDFHRVLAEHGFSDLY